MNIITDWKALFNKPVCQLDENGIFLFETTADLDVYAKDGSYLIPAGCIDAEPPKAKKGYAAKWLPENQSWEMVKDWRGQTVYDTTTGTQMVADFVGDLPEHLTDKPRPSEFHNWQNGAWELDETAQKQAEQAEFQAAQSAKIKQLNQAAQNFIAQAAGTDKVPEFELQSWNLQAIEAKAWAQNPETPTPILDEIAAARGVPPEMLKQAALRKTLAYEKLTAHVVGERQALQTKIETAKNLDELNAIDITFTLPEMGAA